MMGTIRTRANQRIADRNPCPECGPGTRVWMKGGTPTAKGIKRRMLCFECGKTYYPKGEDMWVKKFKKK